MRTRQTTLGVPQTRLLLALALVVSLALLGPAASVAAPAPSVLTFKTVKVGAPGNPSVGIVPFTDAVYSSCAEVVPAEKQPPCQQVGTVGYRYGIGQLEVTVAQYVAFLNTADPAGRNRHKLYSDTESAAEWPKYGQIDFSAERSGRASLHRWPRRNGPTSPTALPTSCAPPASPTPSTTARSSPSRPTPPAASSYVTYRVRLSRRTEVGMYDMSKRATTRSHKSGFVIPSQNEWIKAAYYDPNGGGTYSYWQYPTNPGKFGDEGANAPHEATLDPEDRRRHQRLDPAAGDLPHPRSHAGAELVPGRLQRRSLRDRESPRDQAQRPTKRPTRAVSARSARPRPPRPGAPSTRVATRSSGPTRSPRLPPAAAVPTAGSGDGCTAASPTPPSTSSGSRRSACSRRTTPSTPPPIPGWGFASACSAP